MISLQPREYSLLEYMMRNKGKVLSKTMIMEHVWDYNFDPKTNVVEIVTIASEVKKIFRQDRAVVFILHLPNFGAPCDHQQI